MAVKGLISQVDGYKTIEAWQKIWKLALILVCLLRFMNVSVHDATVQGNDDKHYQFEEFFVKARNIRYVQIPDDVTKNQIHLVDIYLFYAGVL